MSEIVCSPSFFQASANDVQINKHNASDYRCLADLFVIDPRLCQQRIEDTDGGLLGESYRWILDHADFQRWRDEEQERLLWIEGGPGTGKTRLLSGIINELQDVTSDNISYFFCNSTDLRMNNATAVLRGLIYLLVTHEPSLISHIRWPYNVARKRLFQDVNTFMALSSIFQDMLHDPALKAAYFVIDALDECVNDLPQLLTLIISSSTISTQVKWIISSRPRADIDSYLKPISGIKLSLEKNSEDLSRAVDIYIERAVSRLGWLTDNVSLRHVVSDKIRRNAKGTFLFARLVIQMLENVEPWDALRVLEAIPVGLKGLYGRMIEQIQHSGHMELCRAVLSTVTVAYRPLHLLELRILADLHKFQDMRSLKRLVNSCGSLLTIQEDHIYMIHESAREYILDDGAIFPKGQAHIHHKIFQQSLSALSQTLRKDIYDLRRPGLLIEQVKPVSQGPLAPISYACVFWIDHLIDSDHASLDTRRELSNEGSAFVFLRTHFLHWLESLSLLHSISDGILRIKKLLGHIGTEGVAPRSTQFLRDAERFVLSYGSIIQRAPLQTYSSALVFTPTKSTLKNMQLWEERLPQIQSIKGINENWGVCQQALEGHRGSIWAITFSPDGQQLASASNDKTVRIWDTKTGACRRKLEGHAGTVREVAFSPDANKLASASYDKTLRIWDLHSGECLHALEGHGDWINSVAFSPDGRLLASASNDKFIGLWDTTIGQCQQFLAGHSSWVNHVAFSPHGRWLVSASSDRTVRLWDSGTGECLRIFRGFNAIVNWADFSPSGDRVASASDDKLIRIWDPNTVTCQQTLEGHSNWVSSVVFSPDGCRLASASNDRTIRLWDANNGACQQILQGHSGSVSSVAFSNNGCQLASGSNDGTVRLWDTSVEAYEQTLKSHSGSVRALAFSADGRWLASASKDMTVRVWDVDTGLCQQSMKCQYGAVTTMAISPDGLRVALASEDGMIRLCNTNRGRCDFKLEDYNRAISAMAFSSDGVWLASASEEGIVRLWDTRNGQCKWTLRIGMIITYLFFSADDQYLQTNKGLLPLGAHPLVMLPYQGQSPCKYLVKKEWITSAGENLIWLPQDYRATCWTYQNDLLALGHESGQLTIFEFNSSQNT